MKTAVSYLRMNLLENAWWSDAADGHTLVNIAILLIDSGWYSASTFRTWLLDEACVEIEGNAIVLIKRGDRIVVGDKYTTNFDYYSSEFPTAALIDLLNQWQAMCDKRDPKLVGAYITYDGTQFHVQPEFDTVVKKIKRLYTKLSRPVIRFLARYNLVKDPYALPFKIEDINFQGDLEIQGFHFDPLGDLEKQKIITLEDKLVCPSTGMVRATIVRPGQLMPTAHVSMFPPAWSKEEWTFIIDQSLQNALKDGVLVAGFAVQHAITQDGLVIEFIINVEEKELVSAYPVIKKQ